MKPAIVCIWAAIGIYWLAAATRTKPAARRQPTASRVAQVLILLFAFLLLSDWGRVGFLKTRFVPDSIWVGISASVVTAAGALIAIWARVTLGSNWSGWVTVKRDHELIRSGPYAVVRHPIYSGLLLAIAGTALSTGEIRGLIALVIAIADFRWKASVEEAFMTNTFGEQYVRYRKEVKALIPFVL